MGQGIACRTGYHKEKTCPAYTPSQQYRHRRRDVGTTPSLATLRLYDSVAADAVLRQATALLPDGISASIFRRKGRRGILTPAIEGVFA